MPSIIGDKCTSCGICLPLCPSESIFKGVKKFVIDSDTCTDCRICVQVCPEDAIKPAGKDPSAFRM